MDKLSEIVGPNPIIDNKYPLLLQQNDKNAIEYLLSKGADIHIKNANGENIIYNGIAHHFGGYVEEKLDLIRFFVEKGVDPNEKDNNGKTILDVVDARISELKKLIQNGKDQSFLEYELEEKMV